MIDVRRHHHTARWCLSLQATCNVKPSTVEVSFIGENVSHVHPNAQPDFGVIRKAFLDFNSRGDAGNNRRIGNNPTITHTLKDFASVPFGDWFERPVTQFVHQRNRRIFVLCHHQGVIHNVGGLNECKAAGHE